MESNSFYCSELSRGIAEKTYGTASTGEFWLLLEYPLAWGAKAFEESLLAAAVKLHLKKFLASVPRARLLFIKQGRDCTDRVSLFIVRCRESDPYVLRFELEDYGQLVDIDILSVATRQLPPGGGSITRDPLFLVCTHGRRDKCCAKFGLPLFKSLGEDAGQAVWQSSHVGGDRFAANLVCFPHGLFYAHMTSERGRVVMEEYREGRLVVENYRGRACYSHPIQAAEFFVRTESGITEINDLRRLDHTRLGEDRWQVRFLQASRGSIHRVETSRWMSDFQNHITCHSTEARRVPQFRLDDYEIVKVELETR
ncbi:MAG: hypothetical protein QOH25_4043 [Acidobacteriota bacterium]|jgi:hypothetical protein|nr:hypothetical protein [Acidobacteriota bacterium]